MACTRVHVFACNVPICVVEYMATFVWRIPKGFLPLCLCPSFCLSVPHSLSLHHGPTNYFEMQRVSTRTVAKPGLDAVFQIG